MSQKSNSRWSKWKSIVSSNASNTTKFSTWLISYKRYQMFPSNSFSFKKTIRLITFISFRMESFKFLKIFNFWRKGHWRNLIELNQSRIFKRHYSWWMKLCSRKRKLNLKNKRFYALREVLGNLLEKCSSFWNHKQDFIPLNVIHQPLLSLGFILNISMKSSKKTKEDSKN